MMMFKRAKILATLGPPTHNYDAIEALIRAGVNGFRLNCSMVRMMSETSKLRGCDKHLATVGKPVAILQDLQGPKIRLGMLKENTSVVDGDELTLIYGGDHEDKVIPVQYDLTKESKSGRKI